MSPFLLYHFVFVHQYWKNVVKFGNTYKFRFKHLHFFHFLLAKAKGCGKVDEKYVNNGRGRERNLWNLLYPSLWKCLAKKPGQKQLGQRTTFLFYAYQKVCSSRFYFKNKLMAIKWSIKKIDKERLNLFVHFVCPNCRTHFFFSTKTTNVNVDHYHLIAS